ncbi:MAG: heavy metal-binding domain-containing protein [Clostridiales bacterium]|jgi:uncharacterized protein YbjQ (UPF0145 family)|nr:heavy metal-binding domain-containing protein [Clostridiales bacterium]
MLIVTTNEIPGKSIELLGLVQGSTVRAKHVGKDILAGFKSLAGGEITAYTQLMYEARGIATERMIEHARQLGADAIVCCRYQSCAVMDGSSEIMAFGTAVKYV